MEQARSIIAFLATTDSARALTFYRDVLGLTFVADEDFALVFDAAGIMLRIQKTRAHTPAPHTALGFDVPSIVQEMRALSERGVRFERYAGMPQDELGIWQPPGTQTRIAWFKDPDGNLLSLTEFAAP